MLTPFVALALGGACGLRVSLPWLAVAMLACAGEVAVDPSVAAFATPFAVALLLVLALVELGLDKLPGVDHAVDAAGFVLKPLAAAGVAWTVAPGEVLPAVLAVAVATLIGTGKARVRVESSVATGGAGNAVLSLAEDAAAGIAVLLALFAPPFAIVGLGALAVGLHGAGATWRRARWALATLDRRPIRVEPSLG